MDTQPNLIRREIDESEIAMRLESYPVTALIGPRQSGKTTLARLFPADHYFDLENPRDLASLDQAQLTLERCEGLIIIDEIQRKPDIFPLIRYLVDSHPYQKYLILGSASPDLIKQSSESLAGRISYYPLHGFRVSDIDAERISQLWLRGGFPRSLLSASDESSYQWREDYIQTYLERDIPAFGIRIPAPTLRRFWHMVAFYHGNIANFSEIGRSFGIADTTVRHYIEILQGTFMVRLLHPWHANIGKRLIKRPKLYIRDSGLYHNLIYAETHQSLLRNPKLGSSWEGFALECVWRSIAKPDYQAYFWATHAGAEIDLFWQSNGASWACEFKYGDAPVVTKSMLTALQDLSLKKIWVVYPGDISYPIHEKIDVLPLSQIPPRWLYPNP